MGKRFIERPTARQIIDRAEREAQYERALDRDRDWLAANFGPPPAPRLPTKAELKAAEEKATFDRFYDEWEHNEIPDRLGKTGQYEPKSIYSPAPASRIRREAPRKRKIAERTERDCMLPDDMRRHRTFHVTDGRGRDTATITINPFSKRITITGAGFR
ncbi:MULTISPECIES: hypothetical protein [unclassified Bradyrhizobium]|uniref:hypothetical protein n=1 Tax=unclassified Bradyrhizobium TaxID=2631580 RepID=UPI0028E5A0E4|nr:MULTISPECIES: hypothetical protein [unclassified Bradyrhizobium]